MGHNTTDSFIVIINIMKYSILLMLHISTRPQFLGVDETFMDEVFSLCYGIEFLQFYTITQTEPPNTKLSSISYNGVLPVGFRSNAI